MSHNGRSSAMYPGIPTTADGSGAVVWVETNISQGAGAYPITSSTSMAHGFNTAVVNARENLCDFGHEPLTLPARDPLNAVPETRGS